MQSRVPTLFLFHFIIIIFFLIFRILKNIPVIMPETETTETGAISSPLRASIMISNEFNSEEIKQKLQLNGSDYDLEVEFDNLTDQIRFVAYKDLCEPLHLDL